MPKKLTDQERLWREISEKTYQKQITDLATMYGWSWRHIQDSRMTNKHGQQFGDKDAAGLPDLLILRPPEMIVVEVKKELGKTTPLQDEWLALFDACGIDAFVSRPSNFDEIQARLTRARRQV